jgi:hypothetical protein
MTTPAAEMTPDARSIAVVPTLEPAATEAARPNQSSTRWLRSTTSSAASQAARRLIVQATSEYRVGAWLSAEATAWDALRLAAEAIDLAHREQGATGKASLESLRIARDAIREARDFSGAYGAVDGEAIVRMARSHETGVLDEQAAQGLSATDASDRYLDEARVHLATVASRSVEAAQAMDLLAAVHLSRADKKTLPSATALCLRRAALQGQPQNASLATRLGIHLADVGLYQEARWVLEHSLQLRHDAQTEDALVRVLRRSGHAEDASRLVAAIEDRARTQSSAQSQQPTRKIPPITELTPAEFAAVSKPVITGTSKSKSVSAIPASVKTTATGDTTASSRPPASPAPQTNNGLGQEDDSQPGLVRRWMKSFKRIW